MNWLGHRWACQPLEVESYGVGFTSYIRKCATRMSSSRALRMSKVETGVSSNYVCKQCRLNIMIRLDEFL